MTVREKMKNYIKKVGIKQSVLAKNAGMTQQALSSFLNGSRGIEVEEYIKLCDAMNVSYDLFISKASANRR